MKILAIILGVIILLFMIFWTILSISVGIQAKEEEKQEKDDLWY